jgi:hypothetical protein
MIEEWLNIAELAFPAVSIATTHNTLDIIPKGLPDNISKVFNPKD